MNQRLPGGLVLRGAQPADLDQVGALLADRGEPVDAIDHRLVVEDPDAGWESCAVVVDGDRVVSTVTLLDETLTLGDVDIPTGQVELVATDRAYEGRGLVRALMGWAHERSARRGQLAQVMIGIPYFYRQFGYQYAIRTPRARSVSAVPAMPEGLTVRSAGPADIPAMAALQSAAQRPYDLRMPHSPACWRALVARDTSIQLVVERGGVPVGAGRLSGEDGERMLAEVAAGDVAAAHALLAHAAQGVAVDAVWVVERPGSPAGDALEGFLEPGRPGADSYYARVPDVAALLEHVRPVLSARLAASELAQDSGDAVVSFFREHVRLPYARGEVGAVVHGGRMQAPGAHGGAGVAPDLVAPLLFGPYGLAGLAERHPDVYTGPNDALMRTLFPPVRADLLTFYQVG